jgi:hypothetical protein
VLAIGCARASALARGAAVGPRADDDGIADIVEAGALRGAVLLEVTAEEPPFCSIIRIASSGVGRSAT